MKWALGLAALALVGVGVVVVLRRRLPIPPPRGVSGEPDVAVVSAPRSAAPRAQSQPRARGLRGRVSRLARAGLRRAKGSAGILGGAVGTVIGGPMGATVGVGIGRAIERA